MGKAIVSKFNGSYENDDLNLFGKIKLRITNHGVPGVGNIPSWKASYGTLTGTGNYFTSDKQGQTNLGNHKSISSTTNGYEWVYIAEDCNLIIDNKYALTHFNCNGAPRSNVYLNLVKPFDLSEFYYMHSLVRIFIYGHYVDSDNNLKPCIVGNLDEFIEKQGTCGSERVMQYDFSNSDLVSNNYRLSGWLVSHSDGTYEVVYEDPNA